MRPAMGGVRKRDPEDGGGSCGVCQGVQITQAGRPAGGRSGVLGVEMGAGVLFLRIRRTAAISGSRPLRDPHRRILSRVRCIALFCLATAKTSFRRGRNYLGWALGFESQRLLGKRLAVKIQFGQGRGQRGDFRESGL